MFARILDVFELEVGDLVDGLDQGVRNQFRQIPSVTDIFPNAVAWQNQAVATLGVLLLVLGVTGIVLEKKLSRYQ